MGRGIDSRNPVWNWVAKLHRLTGRYDNPMPTWFLAPIAGLKLPTRRHPLNRFAPTPINIPLGPSHRVGRVLSFSPVVGIGTSPTRISDPDPHGSALIWVARSGSAIWMRIKIQEGKMTYKNRKKVRNFHVFKNWMFSFKGWRLLL
jgi:hypothetical protein